MTNEPSCLSTATLVQLAHGEVLPDELHDIEEHVTDCERCRQSIQMAYDDPYWTKDILPVLKAPPEERSPSEAPKVCANSESILRLLGPTDDPNMLRDGSTFARIVDDPPEDSVGDNTAASGAESFHGLSLEGSPRTTRVADLPDLFYAHPPGSQPYKIRPDVVRVYAELDGTVYYLPGKNVFYVQHDPVGSSTMTYYGPVEGNPEKVMKLPKTRPGSSTQERREVSNDRTPRHFVRIVADRDSVSFEGVETTWEEIPRLLEQIQDRAATVLEVAIASDQLTRAEVGDARGRATELARRFGFQYSSYVGVHQPEVDAADRGGSDALDRGPATSTRGGTREGQVPTADTLLTILQEYDQTMEAGFHGRRNKDRHSRRGRRRQSSAHASGLEAQYVTREVRV